MLEVSIPNSGVCFLHCIEGSHRVQSLWSSARSWMIPWAEPWRMRRQSTTSSIVISTIRNHALYSVSFSSECGRLAWSFFNSDTRANLKLQRRHYYWLMKGESISQSRTEFVLLRVPKIRGASKAASFRINQYWSLLIHLRRCQGASRSQEQMVTDRRMSRLAAAWMGTWHVAAVFTIKLRLRKGRVLMEKFTI